MRLPNKNIMDQLYSCSSGDYVYTQRYSYSIFYDVPIPGYDLIQRFSLKDSYDVSQIVYRRPPDRCVCSLPYLLE